MGHFYGWLDALLEALDLEVDEEKRARIMEQCGRACISPEFIERAGLATEGHADFDELIDGLLTVWDQLKRHNGRISVENHDQCFCPIVKDFPDEMSRTFCNCKTGWIRELFDSITDEPVEVEMEKSIKCGDGMCRFNIRKKS